MYPKDAEGIANSEDPDQTAPLGAVWSGSALFAQTYLSEKLGSLRYIYCNMSLVMRKPVFALYEQKGADQPAHPRSLISTFVVRCLDSIISLVSISEISSL